MKGFMSRNKKMSDYENIANKFKYLAEALRDLYKERRELDKIIKDYEEELSYINQVLEFAEMIENSFSKKSAAKT